MKFKRKFLIAPLTSALVLGTFTLGPLEPIKRVEATTNSKVFDDLPSSHWAYSTILKMQQEGVISGYPDGTFHPSDEIKREHIAALLDRTLLLQEKEPEVLFSDVSPDNPYQEAIRKVQQAGIFSGTDGKFRPKDPLTRAQMAKVLSLAFDLNVKSNVDFPDVPESHWANEFVRALYSNGITTGSNGVFNPNDPVTRAHYAVFLDRALSINDDPSSPEPDPEPKPEPNPENKPRTVEEFNASIENNPLFVSGIETAKGTFENPLMNKVLLEGQEIFKDTDFKYSNILYSIKWNTPGYQNPKNPNFPQLILEYDDERSFDVSFDFRDEQAVQLAAELVELLKPSMGLKEEIISKAKEAAEIEMSDPNSFTGNRERFVIGNYEVFIGVNGFLEFGDVYVHYIGE